MKTLISLLAMCSFSHAVLGNDTTLQVESLDAKPLHQLVNSTSQEPVRFFNVKFSSTQTHADLLQTPETQELLSRRGKSDETALRDAYNIANVGDRKRGLHVLSSIMMQTGMSIKHVRSVSLQTDTVAVISHEDEKQIASKLMATGRFEYVSPVIRLTRPDSTPMPAALPSSKFIGKTALERNQFNDPFFLEESYLDEQHPSAMGFHSLNKANMYAKENNALGRKVRIAVIDTGSFPNEDIVWDDEGADFVSELSSQGYYDCLETDPTHSGGDIICSKENFAVKSRDTDPIDKSWEFELDENGEPLGDGEIVIDGHGLQVGSIIAAKRNNGAGIVAAMDANDVELINIRGLSPFGGVDSDIADAIVWAAGGDVPGMPSISKKVDVINLSLGGFGLKDCEDIDTFKNSIAFARSQNVVIVGAAGNASTDVDGFAPGECLGVLTVGANNSSGEMSSFSNYGEEIDVTFEGSEVVRATINTSIYKDPESSFCGIDGSEKTRHNCYGTGSGTSYAAPLASATVAMVRMVQSDIDESQIRALITFTAPFIEVDYSGQRPLRADLMPNAGAGNAYDAVTSSLSEVELKDVKATHYYAGFNSSVEQSYLDDLISNSNKTALCGLYELSWGSYREEIDGVTYTLYGSNNTDEVLSEENSVPLEEDNLEITSTSGLFNIGDVSRVAVQVNMMGNAQEFVEFDLTQASKPVSCL